MVGARYGMIPEDAQCSVSELQNRLAAEHSQQKGLERIIWMPRGLVAGDERQIDFVRRLNEDEQCQLGAEVIEESLDSLKSRLDLLKLPRQNLWKPPPTSSAQNLPLNRFI